MMTCGSRGEDVCHVLDRGMNLVAEIKKRRTQHCQHHAEAEESHAQALRVFGDWDWRLALRCERLACALYRAIAFPEA